MTILVWIRHAEKAYSNNKGPSGLPKHDPPILKSAIVRIKNLTRKLIEITGPPSYIITSPFLRTRQTAKIIIKNLDKSTNLYISEDVQEFLGFQKPMGDKPSLDITTRTSLLLGETIESFKSRVIKHLTDLDAHTLCINPSDVEEVIWIITHGIIISSVHNYLYAWKQTSRDFCIRYYYPSPLSGLILNGRNGEIGII